MHVLTVAASFALRTLYFEAASRSFLDDSREQLQALAEDMERISSPQRMTDVVAQLLAAVARAWQGKQSLSAETAALQVT